MRVLIKGAGDLATGIAVRMYNAGYEVWMTELPVPTAVRRTVAFSRAVYETEALVEGIRAVCADSIETGRQLVKENQIPVLIDPDSKCLQALQPEIVVDAIIAKKNIGTKITDADLVIGVGPGFYAGRDCHVVIETKRGHDLGRVIHEGAAIPNTGVPGNIGGYTIERIIRATDNGSFHPIAEIGDHVEAGELIARCDESPVYAKISGIVRGMLQDGVKVYDGMKAGDIDARCEREYCFTISDKARAIGGGVLEAVCAYEHLIREG